MLGVSHAVQHEEKLWKFTVIGEVLVLGLLVVVNKIPYSGCCICNTAVVLEPGTMVCAYHTAAVYLVQYTVVACVIFTHDFSRCRGYWI